MGEGKPNRANITCGEIESLAVLYACGELQASERAELEAHAAACPGCAAVLARELRLHAAIAGVEQPADSLDRSGLLLAQCRTDLAEALRARPQNDRGGRIRAWWSEVREALIYRPAMGMGIAVLMVAAFLAGHWSQRFRMQSLRSAPPGQPTLTARQDTDAPPPKAPKLTDEELRSADRAQVRWVNPSDARTPTVEVQLMPQTPLETPLDIVGAPGDQNVERALTYLLENSQRFDPDTRVDSLDVLRTRATDPGVRRTLCAAARGDQNPGVRLKALEALQGFEQDPMVHETLLDALQSDGSPWVRAEAINLLVSALQSQSGAPGTADKASPQVLDVLRDRLRNDPDPYVRAQSAAALRELGAQ